MELGVSLRDLRFAYAYTCRDYWNVFFVGIGV